MTKILLSGATGYLGSHLFKQLSYDYTVYGLKRSTSDVSRLKDQYEPTELFDIDKRPIQEIIREVKPNIVLHTATSYGRKGESSVDVFNANLKFPMELLQYGVDEGIDCFINIGTSLPANVNPYAQAKDQFSYWLDKYQHAVKVIHVIPEYFFGPQDAESKFVTMLIRKMLRGEEIPLSGGEQKRDFFYIDDLVSAILLILRKRLMIESGAQFSVGMGEPVSLKKLVTMIADKLDFDHAKLNFGAYSYRPNEIMESKANTELLSKLGWQTGFSLKEGLDKTINEETKTNGF